MKTCPKCGASLEDEAAFCSACGSVIAAPGPEGAGRVEYCGRCGERLAAGTQFCPNCGAPVSAGKKKAPKGKKIAIISSAVAAVVAIAVLAAVLLPGLTRSDAEDFIRYQRSMIAQPLTDALMSGMESAMSVLNSDLTVTVHTEDPDVGWLLDGASVVLKLKTEGGRFVANAVVNFMNAQLLTGALTLEDGVLGFYLPQARDVYYTMDVSKFSGDTGWDGTLPTGIDPSALSACIEKYTDILCSAVRDDDLTVEKKKTVDYIALDGDVTGTVYTFVPTARDIETTVLALADALEGDEDLAELLCGLAGASGREMTRLEAASALADAAGRLREAAQNAGEAVEQSGFEWVLVMEGRTVRQVRIRANGRDLGIETSGRRDGDGERFAVFSSENGTVTTLLSGNSAIKGGNVSGSVELALGDGRATISFDRSQDSVSPLGIPAGRYELTTDSGDVHIALEVADAGDGSFDHRLLLRGGELGLVSDTTVTVNATKGSTAEAPDAPVVDISDYSEEELSALFEDLIVAIIGDLGLDLEGLLGAVAGGSLL